MGLYLMSVGFEKLPSLLRFDSLNCTLQKSDMPSLCCGTQSGVMLAAVVTYVSNLSCCGEQVDLPDGKESKLYCHCW